MSILLVVDDDRSIRILVKKAFEQLPEYTVVVAEDATEGLKALENNQPDALLLDLHLREMHGFELFHKLRSVDPRVPVIFITADGSSEAVIQAMRIGAYDYLTKPLRTDQLRQMVASAVRSRRAMDEPVALAVGDPAVSDCFLGSSPSMVAVFKSIGRVAAQNLPVLVRGESGTGKELVARALVAHGSRAAKPFLSVNCAAIPEALLESELFGHEKGAFTGADRRRIGRFEQCNGGTIFLDEVGDMPLLIQSKVLRLLQEQTFERVGGSELIETDVRIIAATNRPLEEMVSHGGFREDLLYRLNGYTIQLPPLRERREDLPELLQYFLCRAKADMSRNDLTGISQEAFDRLISYDWPGNVRQLQSVVRQSVLHTTGTVITINSLPEFLEAAPPEARSGVRNASMRRDDAHEVVDHATSGCAAESASGAGTLDDFQLTAFVADRLRGKTSHLYDEVIEQVERRLFQQVLAATAGNQSKAAEVLGVTRGKIRDRIAAYGIRLDRMVSIAKEGT